MNETDETYEYAVMGATVIAANTGFHGVGSPAPLPDLAGWDFVTVFYATFHEDVPKSGPSPGSNYLQSWIDKVPTQHPRFLLRRRSNAPFQRLRAETEAAKSETYRVQDKAREAAAVAAGKERELRETIVVATRELERLEASEKGAKTALKGVQEDRDKVVGDLRDQLDAAGRARIELEGQLEHVRRQIGEIQWKALFGG